MAKKTITIGGEEYVLGPDIDLDKEIVYINGKRLTEADAEKLGAEISARRRGRPSLSKKKTHSPVLQVRISDSEYKLFLKNLKKNKQSRSQVLRDFISAYNRASAS